jgi:hypothetical protein
LSANQKESLQVAQSALQNALQNATHFAAFKHKGTRELKFPNNA